MQLTLCSHWRLEKAYDHDNSDLLVKYFKMKTSEVMQCSTCYIENIYKIAIY